MLDKIQDQDHQYTVGQWFSENLQMLWILFMLPAEGSMMPIIANRIQSVWIQFGRQNGSWVINILICLVAVVSMV